MSDDTLSILHGRPIDLIAKAQGWAPIPGGRHGGKRRRKGNGWEYSYPDKDSASRAATHHKQRAAELKGHERKGHEATEHSAIARGAERVAVRGIDVPVSGAQYKRRLPHRTTADHYGTDVAEKYPVGAKVRTLTGRTGTIRRTGGGDSGGLVTVTHDDGKPEAVYGAAGLTVTAPPPAKSKAGFIPPAVLKEFKTLVERDEPGDDDERFDLALDVAMDHLNDIAAMDDEADVEESRDMAYELLERIGKPYAHDAPVKKSGLDVLNERGPLPNVQVGDVRYTQRRHVEPTAIAESSRPGLRRPAHATPVTFDAPASVSPARMGRDGMLVSPKTGLKE